MSNENADIEPIPGLRVKNLSAIASHLNLACKGPNSQSMEGIDTKSWGCSGPLSAKDPVSLMTFDYFALASGGVVSVAGQLHASPESENFRSRCREVVGYVLAAMDDEVAGPAMARLDGILEAQENTVFAVEHVMFRFILHTEKTLSFDFHSKGF